MLSFILFILLIILGIYSYSTREKLRAVANVVDNLDLTLAQAISEDRQRISVLEAKQHDKRKSSKKI